ncbi:hypothetical protein Tco_0216118 [Tanacetum coccineum]
MNPQETQQVGAYDKKWVPSSKRVKISSTNIRLETTVPQKEETFQVIIDIIKNSMCFKAFTISTDIPEIFMTILDICLRLEGVDFTDVPDDDTALSFLIDLGNKGPLNKHTNILITGKKKDQDVRTCHIPDSPKLSSITSSSNTSFSPTSIDYELSIPDVMLNDTIKHSESYQMFIKYSTHQIPPKKSRGKGSQGKKTADTSVEEVEVVTEQVSESARRRKLGKETSNPPKKLKGVPSLTLEEREAADIMQALKESRKSSRRQPGTRGSDEVTGSIPGVLDESKVVFATSSERTGIKPGVLDEKKDITEEKVILEWGDEQDSEYSDDDNDDAEKDDKDGDTDDEDDDHVSDTQDANDEDVKTESDEDEIYKYKIRVRKDEDAKMADAEVEEFDKGFGDQFLKLSSKSSLVSIVKDSADADVSSLMDIPIQQETPQTQSLSKDMYMLKIADLFTEALVVLKSQVPAVVDSYLDSKVIDVFQKELQKHTADLIHKYSLQHLPGLTKKPTPIAEQESEKTLKEYDLKSALYQSMHANKSFNKNPANHRLYHALMEALIEDENAMDRGVDDTVKDHKRKHDDNDDDDDDEGPSAGPNQGKQTKRRRTKESESSKNPSSTKETPKGKAPTKGSKTGKSISAKEPVEEPIAEVIMDDAGDDVAHDDNQPQDTLEPKTRKTPNPKWFIQPLRPPTPDPEWNKH